MKLIIVRHGETVANVKGLVQGQTHGKLTKRGILQAKKVGQRLKNEKIDALLCSDLQRTKDTIKEIKKHHKIPVIYTKELRERGLGTLEGKHFLVVWKIRDKSGKSKAEFKPKKGESFLQVRKRAEKFLSKLIRKYKGKTIVIVSHGGFIRILISLLIKKSVDEALEFERHSNTGVSIIEITDKGNKVHFINCAKHLPKHLKT